jgi:hypothetical protein
MERNLQTEKFADRKVGILRVLPQSTRCLVPYKSKAGRGKLKLEFQRDARATSGVEGMAAVVDAPLQARQRRFKIQGSRSGAPGYCLWVLAILSPRMGLWMALFDAIPAINRWAIFGRPCGTLWARGAQGLSQAPDFKALKPHIQAFVVNH